MTPLLFGLVGDSLLDVASGPDLLRLLAVPVFGWAAVRDIRTRRVPNLTWLPLVAVGVLALAWDAWLLADALAYEQRLFAVQVVLSLGLVAPLGYVFWRLGGFGGADAKAVICLALLFPVYPTFYLASGAYPDPAHRATLGVFSLTILSNTVIVGLAYPFLLAARNALSRRFSPAMFVGRPVDVAGVLSEYGRLLETPDGFTRRGLDIDALRMYLRWRGVTFEELRAAPERYRHPLPTERNDPGDGAIDDGRAVPDGGAQTGPAPPGNAGAGSDLQAAVRPFDEWGADRFLSAHSAYGTTPGELREGLAVLTEPDRRTVWITPGVPFIVPMFAGLVLALTFGDLLFALLVALGFA